MEGQKICGNCRVLLPNSFFRTRISIKGKPYLLSYCSNCEVRIVRNSNQIKLKKRLLEGDETIINCSDCKLLMTKFATGVSQGKKREVCKPCSRNRKLVKNKIFQEAKKLLETYAGNELIVKEFIKKYSVIST